MNAKGHTEVIDKAVAATCTASGLTEGKHCSVCSAVLVEQQIVPAKGHSYDGPQDASCNTCGALREVETKKSSVSGKIRNSRSGKITLRGTASYETEMGESYQFSDVAQGSYDLVVKATGCLTYTVQDIPVGESDVILPDIELVRGDVNGDDMVNARDINGFRREFGKSGTEIGNLSADINGDGRVNARDINVLRQSYGKSAQKDCTVKFNG